MMKQFQHLSFSTKTSGITTFQNVAPWLITVLAVIHIIKELVQVRCHGIRYFRDYVNYVEIVLYTTTIVFISPFLTGSLHSVDKKNVTTNITDSTLKYFVKHESIPWESGALSILLAWGNLLLFLKGFPSVGLYVEMFIEVLKTVLSVLLVFSIFIVSFALSFYVLMGEQDTFRNVGSSIVKTAVMMIGEFEYDDIFTDSAQKLSHTKMSYIIFLIFLIVMPIVIINLLVIFLYSQHPLIRTPKATKKLFELPNVRINERILQEFLIKGN